MTRVRLLRDFPISPDGIRVEIWPQGDTRSVSDGVLAILIAEGVCEIIEAAAHDAAPENKALTPVVARKRGRPRKA